MYDVKGSFCDNSPGMKYTKYSSHTLRNFLFYKRYSKEKIYPPYSILNRSTKTLLKFKYEENKYNYDIVFNKLYEAYKDFDKVFQNCFIDKINYVPFIHFLFMIKAFWRVDCFVALCKIWDSFINDSFMEFYNTRHHLYRDDRGASYYTYFDRFIPKIFYENYIKHRDADSFDLQQEVYRYSWLKEDELTTYDDISSYSNKYRCLDPLDTLIWDKEQRRIEKLYLPPTESLKPLAM